MSALASLLEKAFRQAPGADANSEIAAERTAQAEGGREALSYEVVLDAGMSLEAAALKVMPKLIYFLDCRGVALSNARGVFISVFVGESLYFVRATDFVAALAPAMGLSLEELRVKYGAASV